MEDYSVGMESRESRGCIGQLLGLFDFLWHRVHAELNKMMGCIDVQLAFRCILAGVTMLTQLEVFPSQADHIIALIQRGLNIISSMVAWLSE